MKLIDLLLIEVGGLEKQVRRTFEWQRDGQFVNDITDVVERTGGNFSIDSFVGVSADALTLSTDTEDIYIPGIDSDGGMGERRFRFFLQIELEPMTTFNRKRTRAIVQGYTNHADLSHGNNIDPKMWMYLNNVTTVQDFQDGARGTVTRIIDTSQTILADLRRSVRGEEDKLIRPSDIFARIENREDLLGDDILDDSIDTRSSFYSGIQLNDRRTNGAGNYLHKLITSDLEAKANLNTRDTGIIDDNRDTLAYETAGGSMQTTRSNRFLRALADTDRNFKFNNRFAFKDIASFCDMGMRELDDKTTVALNDDFSEFESDVWTGASAEVKAAASICHIIPIVMLDCFIDTISFTISNQQSRGSDSNIIIEDMTSMLGKGLQNRDLIRGFETRIKREVFNPISNHGHQVVDVSIDAEVCGITIIEITIDGDYGRYVFTSFADSMLAPIVTNNVTKTDSLADGYMEVRKCVDNTVRDMFDTKSTISLSTDVNAARRSTSTRTSRSGRNERSRAERPRSNMSLLDDDILGSNKFTKLSLEDI